MERTTNSHDARRAADYLSKYCTDCVGCTNCIFDIGDEGQSCRINSGCAPVGWNLPSIWTAQDIALAKAMMPFAKTIVWPIERNPNPNHRYFKGDGQRTIPLPTCAFRKLRNENPTPKTHADCVSNLQEEIADVELCISILPAALYDPAEVGRTMTAKHRRWNERLHDEKLWEVDSHED